ncbi:hypothetical protein WJX84_008425 [Apatococcus fuscideae]|uniref:Uncharacterized protein n=1 Tax=Apatococcus fuscideae TaxID=2026836 RepID=A0AAW1TGS2_9CHLO
MYNVRTADQKKSSLQKKSSYQCPASCGHASPPELDLSLLRDEVGILLLGDSVDRFVASDICAGQPYLHKEWSQDLDTYAVCRKQNLTVLWQSLIGVHPEGPWYLHDEGTPAERTVQGFEVYQQFTGALPDVVTLSSAFWDIARWTQHLPAIAASDDLTAELLDEFGQHLSNVMAGIEACRWIP